MSRRKARSAASAAPASTAPAASARAARRRSSSRRSGLARPRHFHDHVRARAQQSDASVPRVGAHAAPHPRQRPAPLRALRFALLAAQHGNAGRPARALAIGIRARTIAAPRPAHASRGGRRSLADPGRHALGKAVCVHAVAVGEAAGQAAAQRARRVRALPAHLRALRAGARRPGHPSRRSSSRQRRRAAPGCPRRPQRWGTPASAARCRRSGRSAPARAARPRPQSWRLRPAGRPAPARRRRQRACHFCRRARRAPRRASRRARPWRASRRPRARRAAAPRRCCWPAARCPSPPRRPRSPRRRGQRRGAVAAAPRWAPPRASRWRRAASAAWPRPAAGTPPCARAARGRRSRVRCTAPRRPRRHACSLQQGRPAGALPVLAPSAQSR